MVVSLRKAVERLGMHPNTLRKYANEGKIRFIKNATGQRLYDVESYIHRLLHGDKPSIVVAHRDRLARFGFDLIRYLVEQNSGEIVVFDNTTHSPESELTADLLSILHIFSCRMHGLRKYRQEIKKDPNLPKPSPESDT